MRDKKRIDECIRYGIIYTVLVSLLLTAVFKLFAEPLSSLFALTGGTTHAIVEVCTTSLRIASIGYVFMGFPVAVQGVLQSIGYAIRPLVISLFRLVIFVFPTAYLFTCFDNVTGTVWWTFPIAEVLTCAISAFILKRSYKERIAPLGSTDPFEIK